MINSPSHPVKTGSVGNLGKILIVEDALDYQHMFRATLGKDYEVEILSTSENMIERVKDFKPDLILLDVVLPGSDGFEICKRLQEFEATRSIPVLFVTGKNTKEDVIAGINMGADDYITKPFDPSELRARCAARLRRTRRLTEKSEWVEFGPLKAHLFDMRCFVKEKTGEEKELQVTPAEFQILALFAKSQGRILSREEIYDHLLGDRKGRREKDRSIDTHISSIRKKSDSLAESIQSVYGVGYQFRVHSV